MLAEDPGAKDALRAAFNDQLARVLVEPKFQSELAGIFGVDRSKVRAILDAIPGVQWIGKRCCVPLFRMPARYLQDHGFLPRT